MGVPTCYRSGLLDIGERHVVSKYQKLTRNQEMTPALETLTNCDIFVIRCAVIAFRRGQTLTIILYGVPPTRGHHLLL